MSSSAVSSLTSGSGIDVQSTVDQLMYAALAPERLMQSQQRELQARSAVLSDLAGKMATLKSAVNDLRDLDGALDVTKASTSNAAVVTATSGSAAVTGVHMVTVSHLASSATWYSDPLVSDTATFTAGTLILRVGSGDPITVEIGSSDNTIAKTAEKINSLGAGVIASVMHDSSGTRLLLTSKTSGAASDINVTTNTSGLSLTRGATGADAELTVDGVPVRSASNNVEVLPGLTLHLATAAPANEVQITVAPDIDKVTAAMQSFASAYNTVIKTINAQFAIPVAGGSAGILAGDPALRTLQEHLLNAVGYSPSDEAIFVNLSSLGVTSNDDGTLTVNSAAISDAVANHLDDLQIFFRGTNPDGWAANFGKDLAKLTSTTDGVLQVSIDGLQQEQDALNADIEQFEARMDLKRQSLLEQFSKVDALLQQFPLMQAQLTAQLGSLTNNK